MRDAEPGWTTQFAKRLLLKMLEDFQGGHLEVICPEQTYRFGDPGAELRAVVRVHNERVFKRVLLGNDVGLHVSALTLDLVAFAFDDSGRTAHVRVGAGLGEKLTLRVGGKISFERGLAKVDARIDLGIAGHKLALELPQFEMVPRSLDGRRYVELRVPIVQLSF